MSNNIIPKVISIIVRVGVCVRPWSNFAECIQNAEIAKKQKLCTNPYDGQ